MKNRHGRGRRFSLWQID